MKKIIILSILSFALSGCVTPAMEKARDMSAAKTLQQKRDVLLKWSARSLSPADSRAPSTAKEARNEYLKYKDETDSFLQGLISQCYESPSTSCAYNYYWSAAKFEIDSNEKSQEALISNIVASNEKEREGKLKAAPGDTFECKLSITQDSSERINDSGIIASVTDNGDNFVMNINSDEINSPKLKVTNDGSGLRVGHSPDNKLSGIASYDGAMYQLNLRSDVIARHYHVSMIRSSIPIIAHDSLSSETYLVLYAFDCNKK